MPLEQTHSSDPKIDLATSHLVFLPLSRCRPEIPSEDEEEAGETQGEVLCSAELNLRRTYGSCG